MREVVGIVGRLVCLKRSTSRVGGWLLLSGRSSCFSLIGYRYGIDDVKNVLWHETGSLTVLMLLLMK